MNFEDDFMIGREFFFTSDNGFWKAVVVDRRWVLESNSAKQLMYVDVAISPQEGQALLALGGTITTVHDAEQDVMHYANAPARSVEINGHFYVLKADQLVINKLYEKTSHVNGELVYREQRTAESHILRFEVLEYD
jgi:hypothetical protein